MIRRSLGVALWSLVGFLACLLGALNALVGTRAGRTLLAQVASAAAEGVVSGSIDVGEVRGSLLTGVVLTDVRLLDPDSTLVAWLPRAELGYNPIDFAAGRVVFMEVRLDRPIINIVQHANGKTNFDELLRLGEKDTVRVKPLGPSGPRSLILLRNVQIQDGSLTLRLQKHGQVSNTNEEIEFSGEDGRYRVRRFEHLNARLAAMRIQAPRERGIRIDVLRLATESSDPKLSIADVVGRVTIDGHTLDVDLSRVRFPGSQFRARGTVQWPRDTLLWNLALRADSATLSDVRFIDRRFPDQAVLHGGVTLASHGGRVLEIQLRPLDLAFGQGRLTGHVTAFSAADSGIVALREGDLTAHDLSLDLPRAYIDSLPFHGRLTGQTIVDGPMRALKIETAWSFRDSLVPGWPESQIHGKGEISLAGRDLAFQPFAVTAGRIDIGTVRHLVPGFDLQGELDASGTLTGTLKNVMFSGTLRHHDGDRPASVVRGVVGLDFRTGVLGIASDVRADSLSLDGLTGRIRDFPLRGTLTGTIRTSGDIGGLETQADLDMVGGGGGVRDHGTLVLDFAADSLSVLDSLVTWFAGPSLVAASNDAKLKGSAQVRLTLDGALDSMSLGVNATVADLQWRRWRLPKGEGSLAYQPGPIPTFEVDAKLDSLGYGRLGFGAAAAHARGTRDSLTWFARARVGDLGAFLAGGRYARPGGSGTTQHAVVDSLAVLLPSGVWFLERPTALAFSDSMLRVDSAAFKNGAGVGRLSLSGDLPVRGPINTRVSLESFPLTGIYALLESDTLGVAGVVTATMSATGTRANPLYSGSFAFSDAAFGSFRAPFMDGIIDYRNRRLNGEVHLWRSGQQVLNVTAHLPLDLALVPVAQRQLPETLSVQARADSVDLGVLAAVTTTVRQVAGVFSADLGIGGTWEAPRLRGGLQIGSAAATIPALNVRYTNLNGGLSLRGDTIRVDSLTATSEEGRAELTGFMRLGRLTQPMLALNITTSNFKALDLRGYLALTASGRVALTGPVFGATLTGRGTVTSGVLHFADLVTKRVVNLDEPWVQDLIDTSLIRTQRLGPQFESVFFDSLRINNLQLTMGEDAWLRSNEANIQLTGSVQVNKVRNNYVLSGTLQAPRGTYRLQIGVVTREFVVSQGTVRYFGTPDLNAELDISARHVVHPLPGTGNTNDITVIAHIQGTLLVPKLTLESAERDLSQTELISYLMFGKPTFELGGGEGAFVRNAFSSLVAGELERTFVSDLGVPLDYFEIRPGDPNNPFAGAQVAAGWAIGGKTFLVLNAGFCQQNQNKSQSRLTNTLGASLQFRFSPEWRTEASFEPVRSCGLASDIRGPVSRQVGFDVFWERRY